MVLAGSTRECATSSFRGGLAQQGSQGGGALCSSSSSCRVCGADIVAEHGSKRMNKHVQDFLYWAQNWHKVTFAIFYSSKKGTGQPRFKGAENRFQLSMEKAGKYREEGEIVVMFENCLS